MHNLILKYLNYSVCCASEETTCYTVTGMTLKVMPSSGLNYTEDHSSVSPKRDVNVDTLINSQLAYGSVQYWCRKAWNENRGKVHPHTAFLESLSSIIIFFVIIDLTRLQYTCRFRNFPAKRCTFMPRHSLAFLEKRNVNMRDPEEFAIFPIGRGKSARSVSR